jgi:hypothetical protein
MGRSLIIGITTTFLIIGGLTIFFYIHYVKVKNEPAINAVPNDAVFILEVKNIHESWLKFSEGEIWKDLSQNKPIQELSTNITYIDSIAFLNKDLREILTNHRAVISVHTIGGQKMSLLFIAETGSNTNLTSITNWIAKSKGYTLKKHSFEKETVYDFFNEDKIPVLSIAYRDQLLICSAQTERVEEAIRKLKYKIPNETRGFEQVSAMAEVSSDINVYVNYQYFPSFINVFTKSVYADLFGYLKRFANWGMFNVKMDNDLVNFTGITYTDDSIFQYLDLFKNQPPEELTLHKLLPKNTAMLLQTSCSDNTKFGIDLTEYLQVHKKLDSYTTFTDSLENRYGIDLGDKFFAIIGNEALLGMLEPVGSDYEKELFAVLKFTDVTQTKSLLKSYSIAIKKRGEDDSTKLLSYNGFEIEHLQLGNFLKLYYGELFESIQSPFYTVIDGAFVFANTQNTLKAIINNYQSGNTLGKDEQFINYSKRSAQTANISFFFNPRYCFMLPSSFVTDEFFSTLSSYQYEFKKFEFVSIQFANTSNKAFFTNLNVKFTSSLNEDTRVLWAINLDTTFEMAPAVVYNSATKQNCILVQDVANTLYYVSNTGSILWKSKLSGKIISSIKQVDAQKTGRMYYLFNTEKQACLIDESGNNLTGYPVRFPGNATASYSLFDFYGDSTYQFFIPLDNNRIVGYSINGKPIQGWNPMVVDQKITTKITSVKLGSTPYVLAGGAKGGLLMYSEKGKPVSLTLPSKLNGNIPVFAFSKDTSLAHIIVTDTNNTLTLFAIDAAFGISIKSTEKLLFKPEYVTIKENSKDKDWAILVGNKNEFSVYNTFNHKSFTTTIADSNFVKPFMHKTTLGDLMVGYINKQSKQINWLNTSGVSYPSFPMEGSGMFTIDNVMLDGSNYLLHADKLNNLVLIKLK